MNIKAQVKFLQGELEKHRRKIKSQADFISIQNKKLKQMDAIIQSANMFITVLACQIAGEEIPAVGEVVIPKQKLAQAMESQLIDWYEDKKGNVIIKLFKPQEGDKNNETLNGNQGQAVSENHHDKENGTACEVTELRTKH